MEISLFLNSKLTLIYGRYPKAPFSLAHMYPHLRLINLASFPVERVPGHSPKQERHQRKSGSTVDPR
jgi:hypothetical protein